MIVKNSKEISLSPEDIKDIILKYVEHQFNLDSSDHYDLNFIIKNKPIPSGLYPQDSIDRWVFDGAEIKVSKNE